MKRIPFLLQGWAAWGAALLAALVLPGSRWKAPAPPGFPWSVLAPTAGVLACLVFASVALALALGPRAARSRAMAMAMAPPELLWGGLALALWPGAWGPPSLGAWGVAFLAAATPGEVRWLAQALPCEEPMPAAYGRRAVMLARRSALLHLVPRWLASRLPLWITATLVLERMLSIAGLGSDWMARVALRDRSGVAAWVLALAALWTLSQWRRRNRT